MKVTVDRVNEQSLSDRDIALESVGLHCYVPVAGTPWDVSLEDIMDGFRIGQGCGTKLNRWPLLGKRRKSQRVHCN
jgi:hypothetical protein